MTTMDTILKRRSIRRYKPDRVDEAVLTDILKAGFYAPSGVNLRPCHFVLVDDRAVLNRLMQLHPYASMLRTAPYAVLVCGDTNVSDRLWVHDCAAATENILLAACSYGLGTCWCAVHPDPKRMAGIADLLGCPKGVEPFNLIALGVPDEEKQDPQLFRPEKVHRNRW